MKPDPNSLPGVSLIFTPPPAPAKSGLASFAVLFYAVDVPLEMDEPIKIRGVRELEELPEFAADRALAVAVELFFANEGEELYLFAGSEANPMAMERALGKLDGVTDLESILVPDLYQTRRPGNLLLDLQNTVSDYCEGSNRLFFADLPPHAEDEEAVYTAKRLGVCYLNHPWLRYRNEAVPPSPYLAAMAQSHALSGDVHLSPAGQRFRLADDLPFRPNEREIAAFRSNGINPVVSDPFLGIHAQGVLMHRTGDYFNAQRVYYFVKRCLYVIGRPLVFEPNSDGLRSRLARQVENFLFKLWKQGALKGASPEEAFAVICDDRNNPREEIDQGRLQADVFIAIARPLEFISIRVHRQAGYDQQETLNIF